MIADLSHYQGTINWKEASPHLDFVILRAMVGSNKDNKYKEYAANCRAYKVPFGTYHYVKATTEDSSGNTSTTSFSANVLPRGTIYYPQDGVYREYIVYYPINGVWTRCQLRFGQNAEWIEND